jgi:hypothetical protein
MRQFVQRAEHLPNARDCVPDGAKPGSRLGRSDHHRPWNMAGRALDSHGSVQEIDVPEFEAEEFTTM